MASSRSAANVSLNAPLGAWQQSRLNREDEAWLREVNQYDYRLLDVGRQYHALDVESLRKLAEHDVSLVAGHPATERNLSLGIGTTAAKCAPPCCGFACQTCTEPAGSTNRPTK